MSCNNASNGHDGEMKIYIFYVFPEYFALRRCWALWVWRRIPKCHMGCPGKGEHCPVWCSYLVLQQCLCIQLTSFSVSAAVRPRVHGAWQACVRLVCLFLVYFNPSPGFHFAWPVGCTQPAGHASVSEPIMPDHLSHLKDLPASLVSGLLRSTLPPPTSLCRWDIYRWLFSHFTTVFLETEREMERAAVARPCTGVGEIDVYCSPAGHFIPESEISVDVEKAGGHNGFSSTVANELSAVLLTTRLEWVSAPGILGTKACNILPGREQQGWCSASCDGDRK